MSRSIHNMFGLGSKPPKRSRSDESDDYRQPNEEKQINLIEQLEEKISDLEDEKTFELETTPNKVKKLYILQNMK